MLLLVWSSLSAGGRQLSFLRYPLHLTPAQFLMGLTRAMKYISTSVLNYAKQRLGRRVGRGECWDLADAALEAAKAKCSHDFGKVTPNGNYVWGQKIAIGSARPGDIIQYRNYKWTRRKTKRDRSWEETNAAYSQHTAILAGRKGNSPSCWNVYEQNYGNVRSVTQGTVFLVAGQFRTTTQDSIRITTSGQFWIYRPVAE